MPQNNPKPGYIVTYSGDSIFGTIDFRTPKINTRECTFKADNETTFQTYSPIAIAGYGLTEQGNRFISKEVVVNNVSKRLFAEYIVDGVMSLYFFDDGIRPLYLFENEHGMTYYYDTEMFSKDTQYSANRRRAELKSLKTLFLSSYKASNLITPDIDKWTQLVDLVKTYNDDVCGEGTCTIYIFDEKKNRPKVHFVAYGGTLWMEDYFQEYVRSFGGGYYVDFTHGRFMPFVGIGIDVMRPDVRKNFVAQVRAAVVQAKDRRYDSSTHESVLDEEYWFMASVGVEYFFDLGDSPVRPLVRGGLEIMYGLSIYTGAGFLVNIGQDAISLTANLRPVSELPKPTYKNIFDVSLTYRF